MAPQVAQTRYPKRKRAVINYEIDLSIDGDLDLEDDGNVSEELGEDSSASANSSANSTVAQQPGAFADVEVDSEFEDATYGSHRMVKKRKVLTKPKKVKPPPKFKPFRLMDLPPELRLKVYEEALVDPHGANIRSYFNKYENIPVHVRVNANWSREKSWHVPSCYIRGEWSQIPGTWMPRKKYRLSPNLLVASKTVHGEAISLLWTQPFIFADVSALHSLLIILRPETISRLRDITILSGGWNNNRSLPAFVLLRDAPLLQNLRLDFRIRPEIRVQPGKNKEVVIGEQLATKLYRDCYPFLKTLKQRRGVESIREIFQFDRAEFTKGIYDTATHNWDQTVWSKARQTKILEAMTAELKNIMGRKIRPKIPRTHI